jgi:hypothetical protein
MSMDLPTADEPAGISTTEEAGLWLRFFVACSVPRKEKARRN